MMRMLLTAAALISLLCSPADRLSGTETETHTGAVEGFLFKDDSSAAGRVPVSLHRVDSDSTATLTTVTETDGLFFCDSLPSGNYYAEALSPPMGVLVPLVVKPDETVHISGILQPTGVVTGKLCIPFLDRILKVSAEIREINRKITVDSTGYFEIAALPAYDDYTLQFKSMNTANAVPFEIIEIALIPGDTASVGNIALFTGNARIRAQRAVADSLVATANVTVTGSDILPMVTAAEIRASEIYATIEHIPEGMDRIFTLSVFDVSNRELFRGTDTTDIMVDETVELSIGLDPVP